MTPVRLEPAALRSQDKHSSTEPLCSLHFSSGHKVTYITKCLKYIYRYNSIVLILQIITNNNATTQQILLIAPNKGSFNNQLTSSWCTNTHLCNFLHFRRRYNHFIRCIVYTTYLQRRCQSCCYITDSFMRANIQRH